VTKDINQVSIVGNLTKDPEFTESNGKEFAKLFVATGKFVSRDNLGDPSQRGGFDDIGDYDFGAHAHKETVYHEVRIYVDHIVGLCKNLKTGDRVVICGELRNTRDQKSYIILLAPQARFYKVE